MPDRPLFRWVPASVAIGAAIVAFAVLAAHAWQAFPMAYLSHVGGIWLALGRDLASGVFFRELVGPLGYGGTRYFPLFFVVIGTLLAAGVPLLASAWLTAAVSGTVLATGLARIARSLGAPRHVVWLAAAAAVAPHFVQQTLFEVRADVLAAGLNLWGLSALVPLWREKPDAGTRTWPAVCWFTLAFSAKVTSLVVPGSAALALILSGRVKAGVRLAVGMSAGALVFLGVVEAASAGRAMLSWRACMFAGGSGAQTLWSLRPESFIDPARSSHLLVAVFALTSVVLVAAIALEWRDRAPHAAMTAPIVLFAGVTASTAVTLASPGTVPSNHVVEWLVVAFAALAWSAAARRELRLVVSVALACLVAWMSFQDAVRVSGLWRNPPGRSDAAVRRVVEHIASARSPVLSESPLWPLLAGQRPFVLDPFALRVVMMSRPDIARDLEARLDARYFSSVILQTDPTSVRGRGLYENLHFGPAVASRIVANYRFDSHPASDVWIYVPKGRDER
jgi:hypothetical protein